MTNNKIQNFICNFFLKNLCSIVKHKFNSFFSFLKLKRRFHQKAWNPNPDTVPKGQI